LEFKHKPVMLEECIEGLKIKLSGIYVDRYIRRGSVTVRKLHKSYQIVEN